MGRMKLSEAKRDEFAQAYPVGTPCRYYPLRGEPEFLETKIRSEPWVLAHGDVIVKVEGKAGGVLIDHITPSPSGRALLEGNDNG